MEGLFTLILLGIFGVKVFGKVFKRLVNVMDKLITVEERPYEVQTLNEEELTTLQDLPESLSSEYESDNSSETNIMEGGSSISGIETAFIEGDDLELEVLEKDLEGEGGVGPSFIHEALRNDLKRAIILKEIIDRR